MNPNYEVSFDENKAKEIIRKRIQNPIDNLMCK